MLRQYTERSEYCQRSEFLTLTIAYSDTILLRMLMRLRLPELLEARGLSPYALAKASAGRISMSTAYRVVQKKGRLANFDAEMLDAICDVLGVKPAELLER